MKRKILIVTVVVLFAVGLFFGGAWTGISKELAAKVTMSAIILLTGIGLGFLCGRPSHHQDEEPPEGPYSS